MNRAEAAVLLVRHGRWWVNADEAQIRRAAYYVESDPVYRREMVRDARQRADELGDLDLIGQVAGAVAILDSPVRVGAGTRATEGGPTDGSDA